MDDEDATIEVDGRSYPVTRANELFMATDGSNHFEAGTMEALRMSMSGIAGNPGATGNRIRASIIRHQ